MFLLLLALASVQFLVRIPDVYAQPTWPSSWFQIDWDKNENGAGDDSRDVEFAYYQYDTDYLFLKLKCYDLPGKEWSKGGARYKWFIDLDGNLYFSGGNVYDAEYVVFVEDTDYNGDGDMFLVFDTNNDNNFGEYEPWPISNYNDYRITDPNIGGWRTTPSNQIEMCLSWASIGSPPSYGLFWTTDQQNPNLDQCPTTDHPDEEEPTVVRNVAAVSQTPTPTVVQQGEHVTIQVVVENKGTQTETFNVTSYFDNTPIGTILVTNLAAGHPTTLAFDWDTIGIPAGVYMIKAWADSSAAIVETDETDNWCTAPATVTVQSALVHDVAAASQVPDKTGVIQGTIVNINVTVSNLGDFTETFNVTTYYNSDPISYQTVMALAAKTSTSLIFAWNTAGVPAGTYYINAMADSNMVISEVDETNNNCTSFEAVTIYSHVPGIFVDKVRTAVISGQDPPVVGLPTVYELTIIVTNIGNGNLVNIQVNETISSEVTFVSAGTPSQGSIIALPPPKLIWSVGMLAPGADATLTFRVRAIPAYPCLMYLNHKEHIVATGTDELSGDPVSDTGQTDTTVIAIIRDVAAISQVPSSTVVPQGETIVIDVTVKNFGNVSETFDVTAYYDSDILGTLRVYNLVADSQTTLSFAWDTTGVPPGTYSIKAEADSSGEVAESNEANNVCTAPATVKIVIHDVAIISQAPSPATVTQGEIVTISVEVKNEGTEPETFNVSCYYNETLLEVKTVTNLPPSATNIVSFYWNTAGVPVGTYWINTIASTVPGEKDTDDNACRSQTSVIVTLPKYQIIFDQTGIGLDYPSTVVSIDGMNYDRASLPKTFLWDTGSVHNFTFHSPLMVTPDAKQYVWNSTSGLSTVRNGSMTVIMSGSIVGHYKTQYKINVTASPSGAIGGTFKVTYTQCGTTYTSIQKTTAWSEWADSGTTVTVSEPQDIISASLGSRYKFNNFDPSVSVTLNQPKTITLLYKTQYYLTVGTNPPNIAVIPGEGWYDAATDVTLTAPSVSGYNFTKWYVDGTPRGAGVTLITVTMNSPHTAIADYTTKPPAAVPVGGHSFSIAGPPPAFHIAAYVTLVALLTILLGLTKRKRK